MDLFAGRTIRTVLVRLPTWVGDAVMATPALRAVRRRFPDSRVQLLGASHLEGLLSGANLFDEYLSVPRGRTASSAVVRLLRSAAADLAIVLPHSWRAAWECYRAQIPIRVGYAREWRGPLLTHSVSPHRRTGRLGVLARSKLASFAALGRISQSWQVAVARRRPSLLRERRLGESVIPVPMVTQYLELVAVLGASGDELGPRLAVTEADRSRGQRALEALGVRPDERMVAVNAGASFGPSKIYPLPLMARAIDQLCAESELRPLLLCGPGEEALARELAAQLRTPCFNTAPSPLDLAAMKQVLTACQLLITTDTGPWHIANGLGLPSVVLMGPTDPRYTASHLRSSMVLRRDVVCGPCHFKVCPLGHHHCMTEIDPGEVASAGRALLQESSRK